MYNVLVFDLPQVQVKKDIYNKVKKLKGLVWENYKAAYIYSSSTSDK